MNPGSRVLSHVILIIATKGEIIKCMKIYLTLKKYKNVLHMTVKPMGFSKYCLCNLFDMIIRIL